MDMYRQRIILTVLGVLLVALGTYKTVTLSKNKIIKLMLILLLLGEIVFVVLLLYMMVFVIV